jgi:single-stranded-DNA-specific exonuclease
MPSMQSTDFLDRLMDVRGIPPDERQAFLTPSYEEHLHDPFLMLGMDRAVARVLSAIDNNEHIVVYSDYDADGIPGGVILHDFFKKVGYENFENYIPHRHDEGYGLHMDAVKQFVEGSAKLIITIDLGITAMAEVAYAQEHGVDVIVTDHHLPHAEVPNAFAILNPKQVGDSYPFKELCGAGVAFKLVQGLIVGLSKRENARGSDVPGWEKWLLDMAGLATLSDMVPLVGENRVLAYYGMKVLQKTRRAGLRHLLKKMKIDPEHLVEDDITFMITPRLNAASRMDSPQRAFEVLSETDPIKASVVADHLIKINDLRKTIVATIMKQVHKKLEKRELREVIVIGDPEWRVGVLGLVASKIVETYGRPCFVWGIEGATETGLIKGSCRSEGSVNVVDLMTAATESFHSFGGHELAGGFVVTHEKVHFLEDALVAAFSGVKKEKEIGVVKTHDLAIDLSEVVRKNYEQLSQLAPFGMANEKPAFLFQGVELRGVKLFGKEKEHLEIIVASPNKTSAIPNRPVKAIAFFKTDADFQTKLEEGRTIDLTATMEMSYFMGRPELRLRIVGIN